MDRPLEIFSNHETFTFLNPKMAEDERARLRAATREKNLASHVWLMSSGTESSKLAATKMIALSKDAILAAAQAVTREFQITARDVYLHALPIFHIAGVSVWARAFVSGCKVVELGEEPWDVDKFVSLVESQRVSVGSLVPTQIFDLVRARKTAPRSLRHIFVGGGALSPAVGDEAVALGWPLTLTYGMTETCAMLAVGHSFEEGLRKLPHVLEWATDEKDRLRFLSPALLTGYLFVPRAGLSEFVDPKQKGWYLSDDRGRVENHRLFLAGREAELVKINGESVSITAMQAAWDHFSFTEKLEGPSYIVALPHERRGFELVLVAEHAVTRDAIQRFNQTQMAFQRLQKVFKFRQVPLSPLGKPQRGKILERLATARPELVRRDDARVGRPG